MNFEIKNMSTINTIGKDYLSTMEILSMWSVVRCYYHIKKVSSDTFFKIKIHTNYILNIVNY